jgi:hypothetical protein
VATINAIGTPTITLGGTFTMSGAYAFTGTLTGATTVTFPTTGTLLTQAEGLIWAVNATTPINPAVIGNGYILTNAGTITVNLPTGSPAGSMIGIAGTTQQWIASLSANSVTVKQFGNTYSTSIASTTATDAVIFLATTTTNWTMLNMITTGFTAS